MTPPLESGPLERGAAPRAIVPVREISVFVVTAYALAWAVHFPILLSGKGPSDPSYGIAATVYMFTPGLAAVAVTLLVWRPRGFARALGLTPLRPWRRVGGCSLLAFVLMPLLGVVATLVGGLVGAVRLDLVDFSGLREVLPDFVPDLAATMPATGFPWIAFLVALGLVVATSVPALVLAFGEELGWRGYLLPRLLPMGVWPALVVSGVVWGLWHSPQLFIQYTHGGFDAAQVALFLLFCVVAGVVIGWLRLASESVWPAAIAHGANNALNMVGFLTLSAAGTDTDPLLYPGGLGGLVGLGVLVAVVAVLALSGRLRVPSGQVRSVRGPHDGRR
ncbi:CAAX prenyl protease-like protein [Nocardiopsis sp. Huas11]|uniref:CPBP family intramembrane glutamic endopeptidase n=1 Tax=Nocardiopsis sp. Huas11 TaxID=2183912 RepID=UPI000EB3A834|nr:type II CAAX endopeptidase family protein [Nocardiopsis sp. Huas11]RKS07287.1 CAAX prenyl protease-like protein [Nocardiopsis sp. Huas11]